MHAIRSILMLVLVQAAVGLAHAETESTPAVFLTVNGAQVTADEYAFLLREGARNRFYHGTVPEAQIKAFQQEVADAIIDGLLVSQYAAETGLSIDESVIEQRIETKLAASARSGRPIPPNSEEERRLAEAVRKDVVMERVREELDRSLVTDAEAVKRYYDENQDKFTQPMRRRVAVIIDRVDPGASQEEWQAAVLELQQVHSQLEEGADFAELAMAHSEDPSADRGGDLGLVHAGTLAPNVEEALGKIEPGEFTPAMMVLEGIAIFRLDAIEPPTLMPLEAVQERAEALWRNAALEGRWQALIDELRADATIDMDTRFLTLQGVATADLE